MVISTESPSGGRVNSPHLSKHTLSPKRVLLLEWMQKINFGRIENLQIRDGEPVLEPRPVFVREIKFAGENGPRPELSAIDFQLKLQVVEFFTFMNNLSCGTIEVLEVKHGLPFRLTVREEPA
jgi:hypothetical protein